MGLPLFDPTMFCVRDGGLRHDTIIEVSLKEDWHGKKVARVSDVSHLTAGFTGDARLIRLHALRGIWFPQVGCVRHLAAR
jgi:hypothetical protein